MGLRALLGLGLLGWGLSILLAIAPHEDRLVGVGLSVFGAALLATTRLPQVEALPAGPLGMAGVALVAGVALYNTWFDASWAPQKLALAVLGAGLALGGLVLAPQASFVPPAWKRRAATALACALPTLGAPLAVWTIQAGFEAFSGRTPIEAFLRYGLLAPLHGALGLFGWSPALHGQVLRYDTPTGPLAVEVGAACSGIQAMALFGGVLGLYLVLQRPPGRVLAFWSAVGLVGVYVANLVRLVALTVVGYHYGGDALLQAHAQAGWMFFVAWALLFAWLVRRGASFDARPPAAGA